MIKELAGKVVDWMEKISDQQYQLGARSWELVVRSRELRVERAGSPMRPTSSAKRRSERRMAISLLLGPERIFIMS